MTAPVRSSWGFRLSAERAPCPACRPASAFFWGRIVALNGEIGAWYPDGPGVMGEASWQASEILEYLNGQIKRDQLAQELTSTIDGLTSGLDQARAAITAEKTERVDADGALATRVDTTLAVANGAAAGVQESRTALAGLDGQLKATWSVKAQVTKDDKVYAAGMSLGLTPIPMVGCKARCTSWPTALVS